MRKSKTPTDSDRDTTDDTVDDSGDEPEGLDGHTMEELNDYLDAGRTPAVASIDNSPGCQIALAALERLRALALSLLERDVQDEPERDDSWVSSILENLSREVHAGRDIPLRHDDPTSRLTITEGAVRGLIRSAGDGVSGVVMGRCHLEGDVTQLDEPIAVGVDAAVMWGQPLHDAADRVRRAVQTELRRHTELNLATIDVRIHDVHLPRGEAK